MKHLKGKSKHIATKSIILITHLFLLTNIATPAVALSKTLISSSSPSWTGFYLGGNVGYGFGQAKEKMKFHDSWLTDGTTDDVFLSSFTNKTLKPEGVIGGIQAGYYYQTHRWVPGAVLSIDYLGQNTKYSVDSVINPVSGSSYSLTSSYKINWLLTARPKLGYSLGSFLPYITGGLAVAHQKFSQKLTQNNLNFQETGSLTNTVYGWTIGAGADYALRNHWHLAIEYLFVDLPSSSKNSTGIYNGGPSDYTATHSVQLNTNIFHIGILYQF